MVYLDYRNLTPNEFEALAKDVMERRLGCRLFRYAQGGDGGHRRGAVLSAGALLG